MSVETTTCLVITCDDCGDGCGDREDEGFTAHFPNLWRGLPNHPREWRNCVRVDATGDYECEAREERRAGASS